MRPLNRALMLFRRLISRSAKSNGKSLRNVFERYGTYCRCVWGNILNSMGICRKDRSNILGDLGGLRNILYKME